MRGRLSPLLCADSADRRSCRSAPCRLSSIVRRARRQSLRGPCGRSRPPPRYCRRHSGPWIPERSATRLSEADLNVLSKLGNQGLEWRLEPEAFTRREVGREDDLLDFLVGCPVDIQVARQPST